MKQRSRKCVNAAYNSCYLIYYSYVKADKLPSSWHVTMLQVPSSGFVSPALMI